VTRSCKKASRPRDEVEDELVEDEEVEEELSVPRMLLT
jgi:hypothetical protein